MATREFNLKKNKSTVREIVLEKGEEGAKRAYGTGSVDNRLFNGGNKLRAICDTQTMLWHLSYDSGILPKPLQQQFTSFTTLLNFVTNYYEKRNIKVTKVID